MNLSYFAQLYLLFTVAVAMSGAVSADDLARFQGSWEMTGTNAGMPIRVVKTIEGNRETVEVYTNGNLTQKHDVEFELEAFGPAKVFIWRNGRITAGPKAGQRLPDGRFIYRIDDKRLIGVHGMLDGDRTPVVREVYQRIGDPPPGSET